MSHIRTQRMRLRSEESEALRRVVEKFGCHLVNASRFTAWEGTKACRMRIQKDPNDYHIGLVEENGGLRMQWDDYGPRGRWIRETFGNDMTPLEEHYQAEIVARGLEIEGLNVEVFRDEETSELVVHATGY